MKRRITMTDNRMIPKTMPLTEVLENYKRYYKKFHDRYIAYDNEAKRAIKNKANNIYELVAVARKYKHMLNFFKFIAYNEYDILILGVEDDEVIFRCTHAENEIDDIDDAIAKSMKEYKEDLKKELNI
jgi:hypothetical protein